MNKDMIRLDHWRRPHGAAAKLKRHCVMRANRNALKPGFNEKLYHPRSQRVNPSMKP